MPDAGWEMPLSFEPLRDDPHYPATTKVRVNVIDTDDGHAYYTADVPINGESVIPCGPGTRVPEGRTVHVVIAGMSADGVVANDTYGWHVKIVPPEPRTPQFAAEPKVRFVIPAPDPTPDPPR